MRLRVECLQGAHILCQRPGADFFRVAFQPAVWIAPAIRPELDRVRFSSGFGQFLKIRMHCLGLAMEIHSGTR